MTTEIKSKTGLIVHKGDWDGSQWTVTGFPKRPFAFPEWESAYDFEEFVKKHVNCSGVEFDSEFCQFFAYTKTKARALGFMKAIEKYLDKVNSTLNKML